MKGEAMREKIVAVIFSVIILAIPVMTIVEKATAEEKEQPETEEGSIAELNREEQLLMQQALAQEAADAAGAGKPQESGTPESTGGVQGAEPSAPGETAGGAPSSPDAPGTDAAETDEEGKKGFMESLRESVEDFTGDLALQEEAANVNSDITSALADDAYIDSDQVLAGKGGWLFYKRADDGTSIQDYQGTSTFSDAKLSSITQALIRQRDTFAARGIRFVVMIVPNKEIIYSEYMPSTVYRTSEITRCDRLYEYIVNNSDLEVVYPKRELLAAKSSCQVYYKYDTHWNFAGVYVGVQCLLRTLYGTYTDISEANIVLEHQNMSGDLASLIGMTDKYCDDYYYNFYVQDIDPAQRTDDTLLIVGDSFSDLMVGELGYYFAGVDQVGVWTFKMSMLDTYQPDVVLWECAERYADRLSWIDLTDD